MAARARTCAPKFPLYHAPTNLSSKILQKTAQIIFPKIVQPAYCNLLLDVVYYHCQGEVRPDPRDVR